MNLLDPILLSLRVAGLATVITAVLGLFLAARLNATRSRPGRILAGGLESVILAPMVFPPTMTGYLLLLFLGPNGPVGSLWGASGGLLFSWLAAVIASVVVSLPLMYQSTKAALSSVDPHCIAAARTLGASERRIFWRITVPLAWPGIAGGMALAFARAIGEFGATLMVAGNIPGATQTIPLALYSAVESGNTAAANLLLGVTVALSFAIVIVVRWSERRTAASRTHRLAGGVSR